MAILCRRTYFNYFQIASILRFQRNVSILMWVRTCLILKTSESFLCSLDNSGLYYFHWAFKTHYTYLFLPVILKAALSVFWSSQSIDLSWILNTTSSWAGLILCTKSQRTKTSQNWNTVKPCCNDTSYFELKWPDWLSVFAKGFHARLTKPLCHNQHLLCWPLELVTRLTT